MPRVNLTAKFVESIKVETRADYWDDAIRGLTLRVSPTGVKSWSVVWTDQADGVKKRLTLGSFPTIDLATARKKALIEIAKISEGHDPSKQKRAHRTEITLAELASLYIERYAKPNKRTWAEDERMLRVDVLPIIGATRRISSVTRRDVLDVVDAKIDAGKLVSSRNVLALMSKLFNWAVNEDHLSASPAAGVSQKAKAVSRDRVLTDDELRHIWTGIDAVSITRPMRRILKLVFLTGQRVSEVSEMTRGEVDLSAGHWTIPVERSKNRRAHAVPLVAPAISILEDAIADVDDGDPRGGATPLFAHRDSSIAGNAVAHAVRDKLQIDGSPAWTPHDARRTMATRMAEDLNIEPHHIEAVLNHVSGHKAGVAGVYNRSTYGVAKLAALDAWARHLFRIVDPENIFGRGSGFRRIRRSDRPDVRDAGEAETELAAFCVRQFGADAVAPLLQSIDDIRIGYASGEWIRYTIANLLHVFSAETGTPIDQLKAGGKDYLSINPDRS